MRTTTEVPVFPAVHRSTYVPVRRELRHHERRRRAVRGRRIVALGAGSAGFASLLLIVFVVINAR